MKVLFIGRDKELFNSLAGQTGKEKQKFRYLPHLPDCRNDLSNPKADIVILDLVRLNQRMATLIKECCRIHKEKKFIVLAPQPPLEYVTDLLKNGLGDLLAKPVTTDKLQRVVRQIAEKNGWLSQPVNSVLKSIGDRLRARRRELKFSLAHLSRRTGLSVSLLSQIERARSSASLASLHRICRALDLPFATLFAGW